MATARISSRSHSGPRHSSYYTGPVYRNGSTQEKSAFVKPSRVLQPRQLVFNGSPAGQVNHVQAYSPALKLAAIAEDYSREESSSNEDLDCDEDSFNFEDIPPRSCTQCNLVLMIQCHHSGQ